MILVQDIRQQVQLLEDEIISIRRYLHENPEIDALEVETSAYCKQQMQNLGLVVTQVTEYGFYAILDTGKPGKTLALRTDLDGLCMQEDSYNLSGEKKCVSKQPGKAHCCGHDGHMAMLLTSAKILCANKQHLCGKIIYVFESGEESDGTAHIIAQALKDIGCNAIWGVHLAAHLPQGIISVDPGPRMAGIYMFEYTIKGKGGHSSRPDQATNPLLAAAAIVSAISSVVPCSVNPEEMAVTVPCTIHGGGGNNIIPEQCIIGGSGRFLHNETGVQLEKNVTMRANNIAAAYGCSCEKTYGDGSGHGAPAVFNDFNLSAIATRALNKILPESQKGPQPMWVASEAFGEYGLLFPTIFAFVGISNLDNGYGAPHHNGKFDFDEQVLSDGVMATVQFAHDYLCE